MILDSGNSVLKLPTARRKLNACRFLPRNSLFGAAEFAQKALASDLHAYPPQQLAETQMLPSEQSACEVHRRAASSSQPRPEPWERHTPLPLMSGTQKPLQPEAAPHVKAEKPESQV